MKLPKFSEAEGRRLVYQRSGGFCEMCGANNPTDWSHRIGRGQGGGWEPSNGIHACQACHRWCHANPREAQAQGWMLRSMRIPEEEPALLFTIIGHAWTLLDNAGGYTRELDPDLTTNPKL